MPPIKGSGVPGAQWRGCQFAQVTTAGKTFVVDGSHHILAIAFQDGDGALTTATVSITVENVLVWSGVPVALLGALGVHTNQQAFGTGGPVIWVPPRPILFNPSLPITIVPSTTMEVALHGVEVMAQ